MKIVNICGARPNFMKIAPLMREYARHPDIEPLLVHTGQHYDEKMSDLFFRELEIPEPQINLEVGSSSHARQTAEIMIRFEPVVQEFQPDWLVVVGDVNSTIACSLVAAKLGVRVAHVEAGLRSGDFGMPEEINRILTDRISQLLFVTEPSGVENLAHEGTDPASVHLVGNVMIDTLLRHRERAARSEILVEHGLKAREFAVVTLHRPSNVDHPEHLDSILAALAKISEELPVLFAVHPRTRDRISKLGLGRRVEAAADLRLIDPVGYLDFLKLMSDARVVLTDSGGIQEETTILGVSCLTLRRNTERPVTVDVGTNRLVEPREDAILGAWHDLRAGTTAPGRIPELWDGQAAERIVRILRATHAAGS
jgi:UDP-N-acetylglucosamine 2-epimerase (non-hydrolysing)